MKAVTGKVVDGRVEVKRDMAAEGSLVTLLVSEPDEGSELENELVEVMAEAEWGDFVDGWELLRELKAKHCAFGDLRHRGWGGQDLGIKSKPGRTSSAGGHNP